MDATQKKQGTINNRGTPPFLAGCPGWESMRFCQVALFTFLASGPRSLSSTSKMTMSPSDRVLNPVMSMAEKWTKTSRPSFSLMKPYPFLSLNHFTVPFAKTLTSSSQKFPSKTFLCLCRRYSGTWKIAAQKMSDQGLHWPNYHPKKSLANEILIVK
jgi:hypothetical protein